ncbi:DUF1858 domain-containing protein [Candidatus Dojkabacteria bacterium]|nr:DUF1858 domain-containing protein [Candidatus Dojkabacteria bacterium]
MSKDNKKHKPQSKYKINSDTIISDIVELYPKAAELLLEEYGLYCINCFMSEFETLEEGAIRHGIDGKDFEKLLEEVNNLT